MTVVFGSRILLCRGVLYKAAKALSCGSEGMSGSFRMPGSAERRRFGRWGRVVMLSAGDAGSDRQQSHEACGAYPRTDGVDAASAAYLRVCGPYVTLGADCPYPCKRVPPCSDEGRLRLRERAARTVREAHVPFASTRSCSGSESEGQRACALHAVCRR